jgi:hypothetical protein
LVELHHWDERWNMFSLLFKCPKRWLKQFEIADAIFQTNFCWTRKHDFEQGMVLICIVIFWFSNCKWFCFFGTFPIFVYSPYLMVKSPFSLFDFYSFFGSFPTFMMQFVWWLNHGKSIWFTLKQTKMSKLTKKNDILVCFLEGYW